MGDGSNPRGREILSTISRSQVFLSLWEKKKRTKRDPRVEKQHLWGQGNLGLLEKLSSKVWTRRWLCERKMVRGCSGLHKLASHSGQEGCSSMLSLGDLLIAENKWGQGVETRVTGMAKKVPLLLSCS